MQISVVGLGCWPIAGITSPGVDDPSSVATIQACFDLGINHLDTAYVYGRYGESELRIARAVKSRRRQVLLATKVGLHWDEAGNLLRDASPATIRRHADESLQRLGTDYLDLLYLHIPDPQVPVAESAGALRGLLQAGKIRGVGVSNFTVPELEQFAAVCPIAACQPLYNLLQREVEQEVLPWCREHGVSVLAYEPLAKGLLTGKFSLAHVFADSDWRRNSPLFQSPAWEQNLALVDRLRTIANDRGCTVAQLAIAWLVSQSGLTAALCGAKTPAQIAETAAAADLPLSATEQAQIAEVLGR